jgi:hypothetical protein
MSILRRHGKSWLHPRTFSSRREVHNDKSFRFHGCAVLVMRPKAPASNSFSSGVGQDSWAAQHLSVHNVSILVDLHPKRHRSLQLHLFRQGWVDRFRRTRYNVWGVG